MTYQSHIEWQKNNKEKVRGYYRKNKEKPQYRFASAKGGAKSRGLSWDLTLEQFEEFTKLPCYYCQNKLNHNTTGSGLDRIDNNKGYSVDNCLPCCSTCNSVRWNNFTVEETKIMISALIDYRSKPLLNE